MSQKEYLLNILRNGVAYSITLKIRNLSMKCYEEVKFYAQDFEYKAQYIDSVYEDNKDVIIAKLFAAKDDCIIPEELVEIYDDIYLGYQNKIEEEEAIKYTKDIVFLNKVLYLSKEDI